VRHALDPAGGGYNSPPDSLAGFEGPASTEGEGDKGKSGEARESKGTGWRVEKKGG